MQKSELETSATAQPLSDSPEASKTDGKFQHQNREMQQEADARIQRDLLFKISEDLLCIAGYDGKLKQVNPAWTRCLGWTEQELISNPVIHFVHQDDREITLSARKNITEGETLKNFENRYICKDGSYRWLSWCSLPYQDTSSIFCIARDITRLKEMEQHLLHVNRMESVGQLSAGVAHHLNNALTPISLTLDYLLINEHDPEQREMISISKGRLDQGIKLIQRLLKFSKPQFLQPEPIHVGALLKGAMEMLSDYVPSSIQIVQQLQEPLPKLLADTLILQQVFVDLILNAVQAMPDGGQILISVSVVPLDQPENAHPIQSAPGDYFLFEIKDDGKGIAPEDLPRIFEPFFTSKEPGEGTGLGLSTANTAIHNHGGNMTITSRPGEGTTVKILLPLPEKP